MKDDTSCSALPDPGTQAGSGGTGMRMGSITPGSGWATLRLRVAGHSEGDGSSPTCPIRYRSATQILRGSPSGPVTRIRCSAHATDGYMGYSGTPPRVAPSIDGSMPDADRHRHVLYGATEIPRRGITRGCAWVPKMSSVNVMSSWVLSSSLWGQARHCLVRRSRRPVDNTSAVDEERTRPRRWPVRCCPCRCRTPTPKVAVPWGVLGGVQHLLGPLESRLSWRVSHVRAPERGTRDRTPSTLEMTRPEPRASVPSPTAHTPSRQHPGTYVSPGDESIGPSARCRDVVSPPLSVGIPGRQSPTSSSCYPHGRGTKVTLLVRDLSPRPTTTGSPSAVLRPPFLAKDKGGVLPASPCGVGAGQGVGVGQVAAPT